VFSFHRYLHCSCVVKTKDTVRIVNEHVETAKKIGTENSPDMHVGSRGIVERGNQNPVIGYSMPAHFNQLQLRKRSPRSETYGEHTGLVLALQVKFGGQGWTDHRDVCTGVHQKVIRAGTVNHDWGYNLRTTDQPEGQTSNISGAALLCSEHGNDDCL
jgi:hypothetical protein